MAFLKPANGYVLVAVVNIVGTWRLLLPLIGLKAKPPFYWCLDCHLVARNREARHGLGHTLTYLIRGSLVSPSNNLRMEESSSREKLTGVDFSKRASLIIG
jgi:hypothetical protein